LDNETLDLVRLFQILRKRCWVIILSAIGCVILSAVWTTFLIEDQYQADVLMYVWEEEDNEGSLNTSDLAFFSQLVQDYQVLAQSRLVSGLVAERLGLDESQAAALSGKIAVGTKSNTRHLTITVTDTDPQFAADAANTTADVFSDVVVEKMGASNVKIIDHAVAPRSPSSPNMKNNLAIGLILGLMIGAGIVFIIELLDRTLKTEEDVREVADLTLLGVIPQFEHNNQHSK
jgi:capsular polysaccharide biosynthesis protein